MVTQENLPATRLLDREERLFAVLLLLLLLLLLRREWIEISSASLLSKETPSLGMTVPAAQEKCISTGKKSALLDTYRSAPTFPNVSCPPSRFSNSPAS